MARTALITGASSGIGRELTTLFAADGYDIAVVARDEEALVDVAQTCIDRYGVHATVLPRDLSNPRAPGDIRGKLDRRDVTVDALVNNAGFGARGEFTDLDRRRQLDMIQVNVSSLTDLTYQFLPEMRARGSGRVLNVASTAAFQPGPLMAVYYATKSYVLHFSEALADEVSESDVGVTALCPGPTDTGFAAEANTDGTRAFDSAMDVERVAKKGYEGMHAGKRVVVPGLRNKAGVQATRFVPRSMAAKVAKWLQE